MAKQCGPARRELGDWTLPKDSLPRWITDQLDALVDRWDEQFPEQLGWDQEAVLEALVRCAFDEYIADTTLSAETKGGEA